MVMDVRGKYFAPGGSERKNKKRPNRSENVCLQHPSIEDGISLVAQEISKCNPTDYQRLTSCLALFVSLIQHHAGQQKRPPTSLEYAEFPIGQIAKYAAEGKNGLSRIGATFGNTQHMRLIMKKFK
jgi:hypothetical protein